jgi:hypothetical protein
LGRIARANHCSFKEFNGYLGFEQGGAPETVAELGNVNLGHLSLLVQQTASEVTAMTLPDGIRFEVQYVSQHDFQKCAGCTSQTPDLVLRHWRFVWATTCERCGRELVPLHSADAEIVLEKILRRANRGAEVLKLAFCDADLRLGRRLGRAFYVLRARDLAQPTSLTSGNKVVRFTMLAAIVTCMSHTLLKAVPGPRKNAAPARHLSRVFPQNREVIAKIVAQSEELDENLQVRFNGETSPKYRTGATSAKEVSSSALAAAKQAIEELGPAAGRLQLLTRGDAIWMAKKELSGFNQNR